MFFSSIQIFTNFVLWTWRIFKLETRQNNINRRPHHKVKIVAFTLVQIYILTVKNSGFTRFARTFFTSIFRILSRPMDMK